MLTLLVAQLPLQLVSFSRHVCLSRAGDDHFAADRDVCDDGRSGLGAGGEGIGAHRRRRARGASVSVSCFFSHLEEGRMSGTGTKCSTCRECDHFVFCRRRDTNHLCSC